MTSLFSGLPAIFTGVLGEAATLVPENDDAVAVSGIFTETWQPEAAGVITDYGGTVSTLDVRKADLPACFKGEGHVHIRGRRYRVKDVRPDSEGMAKLVLAAAGLAPEEDFS